VEYLARKFDPGKWGPKPYLGAQDIRADAITGACLRTQSDELSLWQCSNEKEDVAEVVLALMANSRTNTIEGTHIVLFEMSELITDEFILVCTPQNAQTLIDDLSKRHVDAIQLHMEKIVCLAQKIATKARQKIGCYSFTRKEVLTILRNAAKSGRLDLNLLTHIKPEQKAEIQQGL
jgi:hypothetical protein